MNEKLILTEFAGAKNYSLADKEPRLVYGKMDNKIKYVDQDGAKDAANYYPYPIFNGAGHLRTKVIRADGNIYE